MKKFLPKTINNPQGFTLIELMVVIAIIAVLSVIGITVFSGVQQNARDAKRRADIDSIAAAYEAGYNATAGTYTLGSFASGSAPTDPGSNTYAYNTVNSAKGFWACATLEKATGNASNPGGATTTSTYPTYVTTNAGTLYCKSSQQSQ